MSTAWSSTTAAPDSIGEIATRVRWWRSLRLRTAIAIALLAAVLVTGVGLLLTQLATQSGKTLLREQAIAQLDAGLAVLGYGGAPPPGVIDRPDRIPRVLLAAVRRNQAGGAVTWNDGTRMWAASRAQPNGVAAVAVSNEPLVRQLDQIIQTLLWTVSAAVVVAAIVAWIIADRITARLRHTAASVNAVIHGTTPPPARAGDEVTVLSAALATTAAAFTRRLHREQAFTSDVAHDLRTPLTALVSAAELLDPSPATDRVRRQITRMRTLIEDLLELARTNTAPLTAVRLGQAAQDALQLTGHENACTLTIHNDGDVLADPRGLRSSMLNLINNAHRHGQPPITITIDTPSIVVTDAGPGYPDAVLHDGPRRFTALGPTGGTGLGLAIALSHAQHAGAALLLENPAGGGARTTLSFRVSD